MGRLLVALLGVRKEVEHAAGQLLAPRVALSPARLRAIEEASRREPRPAFGGTRVGCRNGTAGSAAPLLAAGVVAEEDVGRVTTLDPTALGIERAGLVARDRLLRRPVQLATGQHDRLEGGLQRRRPPTGVVARLRHALGVEPHQRVVDFEGAGAAVEPAAQAQVHARELGADAQHGLEVDLELIRGHHSRDGSPAKRAAAREEALWSQRRGDSDRAESEGRERGARRTQGSAQGS